jgi:hypothetical protein
MFDEKIIEQLRKRAEGEVTLEELIAITKSDYMIEIIGFFTKAFGMPIRIATNLATLERFYDEGRGLPESEIVKSEIVKEFKPYIKNLRCSADGK